MIKYDIRYTNIDKQGEQLETFHEKEAISLYAKDIRVFKNTVFGAKVMTRAHWHNSYEILYVRRGRGEQQINSKSFPFEEGSVTVICPRDIHMTASVGEGVCEIDVLQFIGEYFGDRESMLYELKSTVPKLPNDDIRVLFDKLHSYTEDEKMQRSLIPLGAVFMLCGILVDHCGDQEDRVQKTRFSKEVREYIYNAEDIRLKSVSRHFGYSAEHFSRKFHTECGIPYKEYAEGIKMQRFVKYFDDTNAPLSEIAECLGYSDTSSCIRAFKRIYGITPGEYRKLRKNSTP